MRMTDNSCKLLENNPNVKHEWFMRHDGRWGVELINGKRLARSRYMMAKKLFCKDFILPPVLIVHHDNHNGADDRPENLRLMNLRQHLDYHNAPLKYGIRPRDGKAEYLRAVAILNPDMVRKAKAKWYSLNYQTEAYKERHKERQKKYYWKNIEKIRMKGGDNCESLR